MTHATLDTIPGGYLAFDDNGIVVDINRTLLAWLGFERAEIVGGHVERMLSMGGRIFYQTHFFPLLKLHDRADEIYFVFQAASGEQIPMLVNAQRHQQAEGGVNVCVMLRMRQRAEFEEELLRARRAADAANRAKDDFLALVSHELRAPLTSIVGWVQMAERHRQDPDRVSRALEVIARSAQVQSRLVEDLLDVSRVMLGKLRLEMATIDPAVFVGAALEAIAPSAGAKGIEIRSQITHPVGRVEGDAARLQQVAWNLLSNAVKFTPGGGTVTVHLFRQGRWLKLSVRDTGIGVEPELLPYIFERFRQVETATGHSAGGLGLGLAIVHHLVELHNGYVIAESEGPGTGTTFTVSLPLLADAPSSPDLSRTLPLESG